MPGIDDYTKLCMHFSSGSDFLLDSSAGSHTITNVTAVTSDSGGKFGDCGYFNNNYLTTPYSTDFDFGTGDFTIDFYIKLSSVTAHQGLMDTVNWVGTHGWVIVYDGSISLSHGIVFAYKNISGTWATIVEQGNLSGYVWNTWYHIAIVRTGNTFKIFRDGIQLASSTYTGTIDSGASSQLLNIGYHKWSSNVYKYLGSMDELRISKGIARWTSNFTPPTSAYAYDYFLNGNVSQDSRILVINESNWTLESNTLKSAGDYTLALPSGGQKTVVAITEDGEGLAYSGVVVEQS